MSMGGSSSDVTPVRRSSRPSYSTNSEPQREEAYRPAAPAEEETPAAQPADYSLPTYVAVGGGLSNRRIVTKMPQDLQGEPTADCTLQKIIKYVISPEVAASDVDRTVVEDVRARIEMADCRLMINSVAGLGRAYNLGRESLQDKLGQYVVQKEQNTASGAVQINFCDIAVVTHDEGGYKTLDNLIR